MRKSQAVTVAPVDRGRVEIGDIVRLELPDPSTGTRFPPPVSRDDFWSRLAHVVPRSSVIDHRAALPGHASADRPAIPSLTTSRSWSPLFSGLPGRYCHSAKVVHPAGNLGDRKSTRLNSSHVRISYAVFCLKKKTKQKH